jgi:hypothetical protein
MSKFKNAFECYEKIGQWLSKEAPEPWEQITIDFEIIEIDDVSEYMISYHPSQKKDSEKQFFIDDTNFDDCFFELARLTSSRERGFFRKCRFILNKDGTYKSAFEYDNDAR